MASAPSPPSAPGIAPAGPRFRSRALYCAVLALPLIVLIGLLATGQLQAAFGAILSMGRRPISPEEMQALRTTNVAWFVGVAPLLFAAWELGREHTAARRLDFEILVGLRAVVRRARGASVSAAELDAFSRPPEDRPGRAALFGLAAGAVVPIFFLAVAPVGRSAPVVVWLVGAGALIGFATYCRVRAAAYLVDEPGRRSLFRQWQLLSPSRYAPEGRRFVRWQLAATLLVPVWWLVVGGLVLSGQ